MTTHLLQFFGLNRLDGLVLAQIGTADNSGADFIARSFAPARIVAPALRTHSQTEKLLPELAALSGHPVELWQRGRHVEIDPDVSVDVLNPPVNDAGRRADSRSLILLVHLGDRALLWAGRSSPALQRELLASYPGLRADILVLDPQTTAAPEWLAALGAREWIEFPQRDRLLNQVTSSSDTLPAVRKWPLEKTGAVEIHYLPALNGRPSAILLQPWVSAPPADP